MKKYQNNSNDYREDDYYQDEYYTDEEIVRRQRRAKRKAERIRKRKRQVMINRIIFAVISVCLIILIAVAIGIVHAKDLAREDSKIKSDNSSAETISEETKALSENTSENVESEDAFLTGQEGVSENDTKDDAALENEEEAEDNGESLESDEITAPSTKSASDYAFFESESTSYMGSEEMTSTYGILTNIENHSIVSAKNAKDRISPASMTKILTLLVACENISSLDDSVTVTVEDTDYAYTNDCSSVGFEKGEVVTVKDLLYGTILPSGGDAAHALACYVAGSHDAFVDMMNERLSSLGLSESAHFTNCVGIYDDNHYCSLYDMAVIMEAAMDNPLASEVLSAHKYTTTATEQHPEGIDISNLFLRRIEDKDTLGEVNGAKTGYVVQSGNCAASFYTSNDGQHYICVTADAHSAWRCIYDHVAAYNIYAAGNTGYHKD